MDIRGGEWQVVRDDLGATTPQSFENNPYYCICYEYFQIIKVCHNKMWIASIVHKILMVLSFLVIIFRHKILAEYDGISNVYTKWTGLDGLDWITEPKKKKKKEWTRLQALFLYFFFFFFSFVVNQY